MVYIINSMHFNYDLMYPTQFMQVFSSVSCVQQPIIPEQFKKYCSTSLEREDSKAEFTLQAK